MNMADVDLKKLKVYDWGTLTKYHVVSNKGFVLRVQKRAINKTEKIEQEYILKQVDSFKEGVRFIKDLKKLNGVENYKLRIFEGDEVAGCSFSLNFVEDSNLYCILLRSVFIDLLNSKAKEGINGNVIGYKLCYECGFCEHCSKNTFMKWRKHEWNTCELMQHETCYFMMEGITYE